MSFRPTQTNFTVSGGDGTDGERIVRLETEFYHMSRTQDDIRSSLGALLEKINQLPTRSDLVQWKFAWSAMMVAVVAIVVGGIIGGLAWIKPDAPPPTVITVPMPLVNP